MSAYDEIIEQFEIGGYIIINKNLIRRIGLRSKLIYSELLSRYHYFKNRGELTPDGYFFNTIESLGKATCLTGRQQRIEIKKLQELGLLKQDNRNGSTRRYFWISDDVGLITKLIEEGGL